MQVVRPNQQNDIAYNVEHVFNENGREVRKMPILIGDHTFWADVVDNKDGDTNSDVANIPEDGIMLNPNLDTEGS